LVPMPRYVVAMRAATAAASVALSALVVSAEPATRGEANTGIGTNVDPDSRGQIALIIDPGGLEWCDGDFCARTVRVLAVLRNRTRHSVTDEITIMRRREDSPLTTPQIFLRGECGTGPVPLWRVFPAAEPVNEDSRIIMATLGPANWGLQLTKARMRSDDGTCVRAPRRRGKLQSEVAGRGLAEPNRGAGLRS